MPKENLKAGKIIPGNIPQNEAKYPNMPVNEIRQNNLYDDKAYVCKPEVVDEIRRVG